MKTKIIYPVDEKFDKKAHCIIETRIILYIEFGIMKNPSIEDECSNRFEEEIKYPEYLLN